MMILPLNLRLCAGAVLAFLLGSGGVIAGEEVAGPVRADVVRVLDGDTIEISAQVWLGLRLTSHVRIRGIDTPEIRGECASEKLMAAHSSS
jgi:micrococcal nuclease